MPFRRLGVTMLAAGLMLLWGCGSDDGPKPVSTTKSVPCEGKAITCEEGVALECVDGEQVADDCDAELLYCVPDIGCTKCVPGTGRCDGETTQKCTEDGKRWEDGKVCPGEGGVHCEATSGLCVNLCEAAALTRSYIGCEYWPVSTANLVNKDFDYAVIVSNPQSVPAEVTVEAEASKTTEAYSETVTVMPGKVKKLVLPWRATASDAIDAFTDSAYHLTSTVPVSAYQFNPLQYRLDGDCAPDQYDPDLGDDSCYSYTNDASLLLPTAALGTAYMVVAPVTSSGDEAYTDSTGRPLEDDAGVPALSYYAQPSTATLVATEDTTVTVVPATEVVCSEGRFAAGESFTFDLKQGHATQLFFSAPELSDCPGERDDQSVDFECDEDPTGVCKFRRTYCTGPDPSGTRIDAEHPVAVYVGSPCSFVPYNRRACDHLEESLPPLRTWGKEVVVAITKPIEQEPNIVRIVSSADGNKLVFDPAEIHDKLTLDKGQMVEVVAKDSFVVKGTKPLLAAQYLVGQQDVGLEDFGTATFRMNGDPSLTFAAPVEQYRREFDFLSPDTYESSFITVIAPLGTEVSVDEHYIGRFDPIGDSDYGVGHYQIDPGPHHVSGDLPIAVQVYGFGAYTSYMFPAGLNLEPVNDVF